MRTITFIKKAALLMFGLFLFSVGILLTIHAGLGAGSWDIFHLGLTKYVNLSFGQVSQVIGVLIIFVNILLGEIPGWATIMNMYFVGYFIDLNETLGLIPTSDSLPIRVVMLLTGIVVLAWGTFFYLNTGWGAGPRDGLMVGISKKLSLEPWKARTAIEVSVTVAAFFLGVMPGVGTILLAFLAGPAVQLAYTIGKRDLKKIKHRTLMDDYTAVFMRRKSRA